MKCNLEYYFTAGDVEDDSRTRKVQGMLKEKLREKGWKVTRQRLSILQTLAEHKGQHLAAEDILS